MRVIKSSLKVNKEKTPSSFSFLPLPPSLAPSSLVLFPFSLADMGKYMRKAKLTGEVTVVDLPPHHHNHHHQQPPLGVRTRARTLALQRRQPDPDCYLHLRSRRLEKQHPPHKGRADPSAHSDAKARALEGPARSQREEDENDDVGVEASFADSVKDVPDSMERNARETTPCSLICDPGTVATLSPTSQHSGRKREVVACRNAPTSQEIEEFFANAEQLQYQMFVEKYNFDPLNDRPFPGRFEWVRLESC